VDELSKDKWGEDYHDSEQYRKIVLIDLSLDISLSLSLSLSVEIIYLILLFGGNKLLCPLDVPSLFASENAPHPLLLLLAFITCFHAPLTMNILTQKLDC
jgi:hypothetical protein